MGTKSKNRKNRASWRRWSVAHTNTENLNRWVQQKRRNLVRHFTLLYTFEESNTDYIKK